MKSKEIREAFLRTCQEQKVPVRIDVNGVLFGQFLADQVLALFTAAFEAGAADYKLHMQF